MLSRTIDILDRLIACPTVSSDSNLELIADLSDTLSHLGARVITQLSPCGTTANLFASLGPDRPGGILLSGHTDVVPVTDQDWASDPFTMRAADGRLYGRGTCDMKGFDALAIWALVEGHHAGLKTPMQLALSFDEEVGCTGAPPMIEAMQPVLPKGASVIVGEPSEMRVVTGHKGGKGFPTHVIGFEVHSSIAYQGVSAIHEAARLIQWANERTEAAAAGAPSNSREL